MRFTWFSTLIPAALLLAGGCSGGAAGDPPPQELIAEANCLGVGFEDAAGLVETVFAVLAKIDGGDELEHPEYVQHDCDANTFDAKIDFDEPTDGVTDIALSGFYLEIGDTDLCVGFGEGSSIRATWDVQFGPGVDFDPFVGPLPDSSGHGHFVITRPSASVIEISEGEGNIVSIDGACDFNITAMSLTIDLDAMEDAPPNGWVSFSTNDDALTGTITMHPSNPDYADVTVTFEGQTWNFKIDLDTFRPEFSP